MGNLEGPIVVGDAQIRVIQLSRTSLPLGLLSPAAGTAARNPGATARGECAKQSQFPEAQIDANRCAENGL